jgi:transposase
MLWEAYEQTLGHEHEARLELMRLARREEPVQRFEELPGFGWIRALTFYVCIDTPWRFPGKSALWRYCGLGLERRHSGAGPMNVRLSKQANRRLKNVLLGAAKSAIAQGDNPFADKYRYWILEGLHPSTARRNVARCQATTLWSLWRTGNSYDPLLVRGGGRQTLAQGT